MRSRFRNRFRGAGGSAEREFRRQRRQNIREQWKLWLGGAAFVVVCVVWSFYLGPVGSRFMAGLAGAACGVFLMVYALGGHMSSFRWRLGAEGERETAKQIEKLGPEWHCEHDLAYEHGNYDHVLVGPPGVFLLDSKRLNGTAAAGGDALHSGRLRYPGAASRGGAKRIKVELERRLGFRAPWVQGTMVIWGDFPQKHYEEQGVIYVEGEQLVSWLSGLPEKVTAPQRAAYVTALREVRTAIAAEGTAG